MSLPDDALGDFYTLATNVDRKEVERIIMGLSAGQLNPMEQKKHLARTIVTEMHGEAAAQAAQAHFERTVQRGEVPDEVPTFALNGRAKLAEVIVDAGLAPSRREARRLLEQGSVSLDGAVAGLDTEASPGQLLQVGKRRWRKLV
jgi:tyrosyl-tRNA synthetase